MVFVESRSIDDFTSFSKVQILIGPSAFKSRGLVALQQNVDWFERNTHTDSPTLFIKSLFSLIYWYFFSKGENPSNGEKLR